MQWVDEGVVLGARRHGESGVILELMTRDHGRHLGLVHGGRSKTLQPVLQPGNTVHATWRARLDEHLGTYQIETKDQRAARFIASPLALYGLATLAALLRLLPERDPHRALFETLAVLVDHLDDRDLDGGPRLRLAEERPGRVRHGGRTLSRPPPCAAGISDRPVARQPPVSGGSRGRVPADGFLSASKRV
jgi:DNA repair protein RecO (recombination protein O)